MEGSTTSAHRSARVATRLATTLTELLLLGVAPFVIILSFAEQPTSWIRTSMLACAFTVVFLGGAALSALPRSHRPVVGSSVVAGAAAAAGTALCLFMLAWAVSDGGWSGSRDRSPWKDLLWFLPLLAHAAHATYRRLNDVPGTMRTYLWPLLIGGLVITALRITTT